MRSWATRPARGGKAVGPTGERTLQAVPPGARLNGVPRKSVLLAAGLPLPRGTYSHAIRVSAGSDLLFVSGLTARDADGSVVAPGDAAGQAARIFGNLQLLLSEAGATLDDVVKATYFVTDLRDREVIEQVRSRFFNAARAPAATMVEVSGLVDRGFRLEAEFVAILPS
jgi:2-iminobutanoate/2-iminopropanoate deaminase